MDNLLAGKRTSQEDANLPHDVQHRSLLHACGKHSAEADHHSAGGRKLIAFRPE
jgi:hypothetical protein